MDVNEGQRFRGAKALLAARIPVVVTIRPAVVLLLAIALQPQSGAPTRDTRATSKPTTITGRITDRDSGLPLPRIVVTLYGAEPAPLAQVLTDDQGRYAFSALVPGDYSVMAGPDEHRSTYLRHRFGESEPTTVFAGRPTPNIELEADATRSDVDIALWRGLEITGRVLDPWDEPMAEVEVQISGADRDFQMGPAQYTDDRGVYRVYGLRPGLYRICANPQGRSDVSADTGSRLVRTCYPASVGEAETADVVLTSEDTAGIDIRVQAVGSYSVSGTVVDSTGVPAGAAGVSAYPMREHGVSTQSLTRNGEFVLKGLTSGQYLLVASVGGSNAGDSRPAAREREMGYSPVVLDGIDATGITLALSKPVRISGKVRFEGGPVPRGDGLKMVVQTRVAEEGWQSFQGRPPFSSVSAHLAFQLDELYRLPVVIGIENVPDGWVLKSVRYDNRDITQVPTEFGEREGKGALEIVLTNRTVRPSVRVTDDRGGPVTAYQVVAVPADPARWPHALSFKPGTPSLDGVMDLGAMLPGKYLVAAIPMADYLLLARHPARVSGLARIGTVVTLNEGAGPQIDLQLTNLPAPR